jgi:hypothetical protein
MDRGFYRDSDNNKLVIPVFIMPITIVQTLTLYGQGHLPQDNLDRTNVALKVILLKFSTWWNDSVDKDFLKQATLRLLGSGSESAKSET